MAFSTSPPRAGSSPGPPPSAMPTPSLTRRHACASGCCAFSRAPGLVPSDAVRAMGQWAHGGGCSVDSSVRIEAEDCAGRERLLRYCARLPFTLTGRANSIRSACSTTMIANGCERPVSVLRDGRLGSDTDRRRSGEIGGSSRSALRPTRTGRGGRRPLHLVFPVHFARPRF